MPPTLSITEISRAVNQFVASQIPGESAVQVSLILTSGKAFTFPVIQSAPTTMSEDAPTALSDLSDMERDIVQALAAADGPLKGAELAIRAGYTEKGIGRNGVEPGGRLRQAGIVRHGRQGYELTEAGYDLIP